MLQTLHCSENVDVYIRVHFNLEKALTKLKRRQQAKYAAVGIQASFVSSR